MIQVYKFVSGRFERQNLKQLVIVAETSDRMQVYDMRAQFLLRGGGTPQEFVEYIKANGVKVLTTLDSATMLRVDGDGGYPESVRIHTS